MAQRGVIGVRFGTAVRVPEEPGTMARFGGLEGRFRVNEIAAKLPLMCQKYGSSGNFAAV